jgi:hypothetical protein
MITPTAWSMTAREAIADLSWSFRSAQEAIRAALGQRQRVARPDAAIRRLTAEAGPPVGHGQVIDEHRLPVAQGVRGRAVARLVPRLVGDRRERVAARGDRRTAALPQ